MAQYKDRAAGVICELVLAISFRVNDIGCDAIRSFTGLQVNVLDVKC